MAELTEKKMELLAPVGSVAAFYAAVDEGADAVYIGVPALSAREPVREFTWPEIDAMLSYARRHGRQAYLAMNSLLKEAEIPLAVKCLAMISAMRADGLIIQDLGLYRLAKKHFPELRLHASTLLAAHNSAGVQQFKEMGFSRVVLARELTIREISLINRQCGIDLEVFVHGALCFSCSGLCMFSSSLGGKSGLRGRCVQPCRRRYSWPHAGPGSGSGKRGRSGYFFSMKDLCGIDLLPALQKAGVKSLKIEGRLRSAQYVATVVKAYRLVLDAGADDQGALVRAREILDKSMSRDTCSGYFMMPQPKDIISPNYSGNIGIYLGRAAAGIGRPASDGQDKGRRVSIVIREALAVGDRLRVHHEKTGERSPFTLNSLRLAGQQVATAAAGSSVEIVVPCQVLGSDSFYKVDTGRRRQLEASRLVGRLKPGRSMKDLLDQARVDKVLRRLGLEKEKDKAASRSDSKDGRHGPAREKGAGRLDWWLKVSDLKTLQHRFSTAPRQVIVTLCRSSHNDFRRNRKYLQPFMKKIIWALPPVIYEKDLDFYGKAIKELLRGGFVNWQVAHIGQLQFFKNRRSLKITGDYSLNILNSLAAATTKECGLHGTQLSIENDRENLAMICAGARAAIQGLSLGMTVYGRLPLFIARLAAGHFKYDRTFLSPKEEGYLLIKAWGLTLALPDRPFSLLPFLLELEGLGIAYAVVDLSNIKVRRDTIMELEQQLTGKTRKRQYSAFNYQGILL